MKNLIAVMFGLIGVVCILGGFYVGVWHWFFCSIVDIINQLKMPTTEATAIAWDICKIIFCEILIYLGMVIGGVFFGIAAEVAE